MRIDFKIDGGLAAFPGLAKPVTINCDALPAAQTAHLRGLIDRAEFFTRPRSVVSTRARDGRAYTIAVDDDGQCRTLTVTEPIDNAALRDLVAELRVHAKNARGDR